MLISPLGKHTKGGGWSQRDQRVIDTGAVNQVVFSNLGGDTLYGISFYWVNAFVVAKQLELRVNGLAIPGGTFTAGARFDRATNNRTEQNSAFLFVAEIPLSSTFAIGSCYLHGDTTNIPYGYPFEAEAMAKGTTVNAIQIFDRRGIWPRELVMQVTSIVIRVVDGTNAIANNSDFRLFT